MKAFLRIIGSIWFFICMKITFFISGKKFVLDQISSQLISYITEDIKNMIKMYPDLTKDEAYIVKLMLLEFYTEKFMFLSEEKEEVMKKTKKILNTKINWIIANK